jgi:hypothetical protein
MEVNELVIIGGSLIAGVIFFIVAGNYMDSQSKSSAYSGIEGDAEWLSSLIERMANEPFDGQFETVISRSDIIASDGVLTLSRGGISRSKFVPQNVQNAELLGAVSICLLKKGNSLELFEKCPE